MQPNPGVIEELVRRIVEVAHPTRIILFGSAARAEMRPGSDLDVLVVVPGQQTSSDTYAQISRSLSGLNVSVDLVLASEEELARFGWNWSLVYYWALREGREIYAA